MITKNTSGFEWKNFLLAVLFFIAFWVSINNPISTLVTLGIVFGVIAIVQGIHALELYFEIRKSNDINPWYLILIGIIDSLVGFYLVFNPSISITFIPILFAVWFMIDSVMNILLAFRLKEVSNTWFWIRLLLGIIGVIVGLSLIGNILIALVSVTYLIAFYFLTAGVIKLIDAFV